MIARMTATSLLALESPWSESFDEPAVEWRRLFSEVLGTFFLVLVGAGGGVVNAATDGGIGRGLRRLVGRSSGLPE